MVIKVYNVEAKQLETLDGVFLDKDTRDRIKYMKKTVKKLFNKHGT